MFQEQQPGIPAKTSALWTKSMWAYGFINKTEAAWLVKIASHDIKLAMFRSGLSDDFRTVEN